MVRACVSVNFEFLFWCVERNGTKLGKMREIISINKLTRKKISKLKKLQYFLYVIFPVNNMN
jgi:hypothetical protein